MIASTHYRWGKRRIHVVIRPVTTENFKDLPNFRLFPFSCKYCTYWESREFNDKTKKEDAEETKQKWLTSVGKEFGNCAFIVYVDKTPVGFTLFAPAKYFPTLSKYARIGAPSKDAVFLACLYIARRELWKKGIGKKLLERVISHLRDRVYEAIETFARFRDTQPSEIGDWLGSAEFFLKMHFALKNQKDEIALLRRELKPVVLKQL